MSKFRAVIHTDTVGDREVSRGGNLAMGVGISEEGRSSGRDYGVYVKVIIRDGKPHYFVSASGDHIATVVYETDGSYKLVEDKS